MPKVKISEYSATANSNTDVASINIDEGCAPSGINNAIRAVMGHLKDFQQGTNGDPFNGPVNGTLGATTASTANVTTLTTSSTVTHNGGTANGVAYLNGSKVLTTGSALSFDGTNFTAPRTQVTTVGTPPAAGAGIELIGSTSPLILAYNRGTSAYISLNYTASAMQWNIGASAAMLLDASGNLGIGTSSPVNKLVVSNAGANGIEVNPTSGVSSGASLNGYNRSTLAFTPLTYTALSHHFQVGSSPATAATLDSSGNLLVGTTSSSENSKLRVQSPNSTEWSDLTFLVNNSSGTKTFALYNGAAGFNAAQTVAQLAKNTSTCRSLNAAGTVNASGADYAEYMTKDGNFIVAKGDVVGINAQGKLTNVFADAVSFCVKSTDPSYVGGDVWGTPEALGLSTPEKPSQRQATEEVEAETDADFAVRQTQYESDQSAFDAALEAARQTVDRIAFAGQVPVNVTGATAGQYIIPVNNNGAIKGEAVSNPTFEQYQTAVGKVIAIESDGRAKIIVKVA